MAARIDYATVDSVARRVEQAGQALTAGNIQAALGYGSQREIQRHLNTLARRRSVETHAIDPPESCIPRGGPRTPPTRTPSRGAEAAALDRWIAARKAEGYGASPVPVPPQVQDTTDEEDERTPATKEAWRRRETVRLVRSLLDEAVPWLAALGLVLGLASTVLAQTPCVPTTTFGGTVTLSWEAPTPVEGVRLSGYVLERRTDEGPWVALPAPGVTTTTVQDTSLAPGHSYVYQLRAQGTDAGGNVALSAPASYGTPPPCVQVTGQPAPNQFRLKAQ